MAKNTDTFLHYREGKTQSQRFLEELNPDRLQLNDLDVADWLLFAFNFAQHLNYFDKENPSNSAGNWQSFFDHFDIRTIIKGSSEVIDTEVIQIPRREEVAYKKIHKNITKKLSEFEKEGTLTPHLVLFVSFLKILEHSKERFNNLTKRHLDFYYGDVLQLEKKRAVADKAYVIFELAKKAIEEKIPEGTLLDGKKDANGKKRIYKVSEDLIANQAQVVAIKSFLKYDSDNEEEKGELKMAPVANSLDGLGKEFNEDVQYWWPFGYNSKESKFKELPDAILGFAVASPVLSLQKGDRKVTVNISYDTNYSGILSLSNSDIINNIEILCSGEKEWLLGNDAIESITNTNIGLTFVLNFPADFPSIVEYTNELSGNFTTKEPLLRFLIKGNESHKLYTELAKKKIEKIKVDVRVSGLTDLILENDNGTINSKKPFYPFTAQPIIGSNFVIKSPEVFNKNWDSITVKINWKNTPNSFTKHYEAYVAKTIEDIPRSYYTGTGTKRSSVIKNDSYFTSKLLLHNKEKWITKSNNVILFTKKDASNSVFETSFSITNNQNDISTSIGSSDAIRLALNQSFLQEIYPVLYTLTLTGANTNPPIPNQAYVPLVESIEIEYTASETQNVNAQNERLSLFLEDAFGFYEDKEDSSNIVPIHSENGELFIGLSALPGQQISLLIQNIEGSENPLTQTFEEDEVVKWDILSNNKWRDLSKNILINETENFLQSGIVKFSIPKDLDVNNTRLTNGLVWIKASMNKEYDAVCKTRAIFSQAVVARFENEENDVSHLEEGLPANTIDKLQTRIPKIKTVTQPYNSIEGMSEESDLEYYRRISERLRHKNRAITQWDYEQLVLQNFPDIFKVKCLNHTSRDSFMAPGYVTLIVVPSTSNKNIFDIYQPRVSQNTLKKVTSYINDLNAMQVNTIVMSPDYQEIKVEVSVKFYKEYDDHFYSKQLNEDLKKFISPWAFNSAKEITFDAAMNRYQMIDYIERLEYVDYIDKLKISKDEEEQKKTIIQADPKSILVSVKEHIVQISNDICNREEVNIGIRKKIVSDAR